MSNSLNFSVELTAPGVMDKTITLEQPLIFPRVVRMSLQTTAVEISDLIPNIFNGRPYGLSFDNTRLRVGTDTQPMTTVQLTMGRYNTAQISAAVNAVVAGLGWWADPADPGLTISGNEVIQKIVFVIDSTKLNPVYGTQFMVDLAEATTSSTLYHTLGFTSTTSFLVDGVYGSVNFPLMETQGTACYIESDLAEPRRIGSTMRRILAQVPFAGKTSFSNTVWPVGAQISAPMNYIGEQTLTSFSVRVRTRKGAPMVFMGGDMTVDIQFII